jgi:hypothetical protein
VSFYVTIIASEFTFSLPHQSPRHHFPFFSHTTTSPNSFMDPDLEFLGAFDVADSQETIAAPSGEE